MTCINAQNATSVSRLHRNVLSALRVVLSVGQKWKNGKGVNFYAESFAGNGKELQSSMPCKGSFLFIEHHYSQR
ncbi:MAG: hypothetical protein HXS54_00560 [Theionarchaea archaeon]|nr:hypothetical protein [Theionarchaea archaeon]